VNSKKTLRTALCTALIVTFALGLCIAPAFAAPWVLTATPGSSSYAKGALVTINGAVTDNAVPAADILVSIMVTDSAGTLVYQTIVTTNASGQYLAQFRIGTTSPTGSYTISAAASSGGIQVATAAGTFTVTSPTSLNLTPNNAPPGASVAFSGAGFTASQQVSVTLNWDGLTMALASSTSTSTGAVSGTFTVPNIQSRVYTVTATDAAGLSANALFGIGQANVTGLQSAITIVGQNIDSIISTLSGMGATLSTIDGNTAGLSSSIGSVSTAVSNLGASISTINSGVADVQSKVGGITTSLSSLNAQITSVQGDVATLTTSVGTVTTSLSSIDTMVTGISGDVATIKTDVGTIQGTVTSVSGTVATINTAVGTMQADISAIKTDVSNTQSSTANLSPLIIVAIVLALIAAIAAIASIILMRRKIAG
jgi:hypothetical protein